MTAKVAASLDIPTADWVTIPDLYADPYPIYRTLRQSAPIHWVPAVNRYLVIGYDACHTIELDPARFSADEAGSLMKRSMGHSMLRKDNPEHDTERRSLGGTLRPKAIKEHWNAAFARNAATYLDRLRDAGSGADLVKEFAAPFAAENLREVLGFRNATQADLQRWSQTLIDGTGNYADDPSVWAHAARSSNEVDAAVDEMLAVLRADPDASLLGQLAGTSMPLESIRANLKMAIGGGLNEPRDAIATTVWALLSHPAQRADVVANDRWSDAFEESIRWVAPISMYPREVTTDTELAGMALPSGARLGVVIGAANRDAEVFVDPESYDIDRPKKPHLAFGGGQHFCAGAWVARASVVGVALPALFREFSDLRLDPQRPETLGGWVFRGVTALPVQWS
ncbi:cytochrome P450 [Rhodococcus sp. IEGM 1354]|uniref:cytochrome P450 n=1 Tax=Rhodococcus sp. IEGM 1354 TaxID=3047088 RepID=UPI0024B7B3D4|nr:cytochrome P450 [Rhodococcus sp. IEGM 1354]MDI9933205.1 cytochrome P450 [Rhodococcus sp. IEGM 1354]